LTALKKPHNEFRLDMISPLDVRAIGLDSLLTQLWLRTLLGNRKPARRTLNYATIPELAREIERPENERFRGFDTDADATEGWIRADLVRPLRRDRLKYTVARPLHANAVRLRSNIRQASDSDTSLAVYSWLKSADAPLLKELRALIDGAVDPESDDLITLAVAYLGAEQEADQPARPDEEPEVPTPLSRRTARDYCDDVRRLLAYRDVMPRPSLIAHLRRLTGFHLALYLLRVSEIVVQLAADGRLPKQEPRLDLIVDFGEDSRSSVARLAAASWGRREHVLHEYIRAHIALKKLDQFAVRAASLWKTPLPEDLDELAAIETSGPAERLADHFHSQIADLIDSQKDQKEELLSLAADYRDMGLSEFRVYAGVIAHLTEGRWFGYHRELIDSLFSKNSSEGFLRQPLGGRSRRRPAMGADLLETLTLIALVAGKRDDMRTQPLRVDELIPHLENRYDCCIATPPSHLSADLEAARSLAGNRERFKTRLRETGLFRDLSDAFVAQLVRPRFVIA
jgi:hypothetical protein